ncbi:hypothetical protein QCA50_006440 [Cerrena zonata]|uniref:Uncharacterized protein n=1 Tax=Cerrena zonata TaxID=2478898 RepID=A0AAW0GAC7_9APHY
MTRLESVLTTKGLIVPVSALRVQSNIENTPRLSREGHEKLRNASVLGPDARPKRVWLNNFRERQANFEGLSSRGKPDGKKKNKTKSVPSQAMDTGFSH